MATVREIKRRIKSVQDTQQITKAMKMVAASKLRKVEGRMLALRPFDDEIEKMFHRISSELPHEEHPLLQQREAKKIAILVVTSDRGLCGAFNNNIIKKCNALIDENEGKESILITIGKKGNDFFRKHGCEIVANYVDIIDSLSITTAGTITETIVEKFTAGEIDEMHLVYAEFVNRANQNIVTKQILPIVSMDIKTDASDQEDEKSEEEENVVYYCEPSVEDICSVLLKRRLTIQIYRAMMECTSSELAARMMAMEAASQNALEMIDTLTLEYNRARQEAITGELLDLVGGAEALKA